VRSLRRYLLLLVGLSLLACVAVFVSVVVQRDRASHEQTAVAARQAEDLVVALATWWERDPRVPRVVGGGGSDDERFAVSDQLSTLLSIVSDGSAGFCTQDGRVTLSRTRRLTDWAPAQRAFDESARQLSDEPGPRGDVRLAPPFEPRGWLDELWHALDHRPPPGGRPGDPPRLLDLDSEVVKHACYSEKPRLLQRSTAEVSHNVLVTAVQGVGGTQAAWSLVRLDRPRSPAGLVVPIIAAALFVTALMVIAADALTAFNRGASQLVRSLQRLEVDLEAQVERPDTRELASIAERIEAMARKLLVARQRERALEHQLGTQQRLVGLGRVVAGVAHEVRNPLTVLKLRLETMARRRLDERSHGDVETCLGEIARLDRVVGSLLMVARKAPHAAGNSSLESLGLGQLVDARLQGAEASAGPRGLTLRRRGDARAVTSSDDLTRVLDNLVRNAVEASPDGGEVRVEIEEGDRERVRVAVIDRGPGVPEARVAELFEPFFTLKADGTGLGLFVSRALVEARGGTLVHERADGETRFIIHLPKTPPHADPPPPPHRG
jgi:signal transduction histidine kinase